MRCSKYDIINQENKIGGQVKLIMAHHANEIVGLLENELID